MKQDETTRPLDCGSQNQDRSSKPPRSASGANRVRLVDCQVIQRLGLTPPPTSPAEKFLTFSLVGSLLEGSARNDATAGLFLALYKAFDERKASFAQGTLQIVLDAETANRIAEKAKSLGLNVTVRDQ